MQYSCGCINEIDPSSGVLHCVKKCEGHIEYSRAHSYDGIEHYIELGCLDKDGVPQNFRYIGEFIEGFQSERQYLFHGVGGDILEIGCGLGMYVPFFLENDWAYEAIDTSEFAVRWVANCFNVVVQQMDFAEVDKDDRYDAILAAHVFEHMVDAPAMITKAHNMLRAEFGHLFIIVPDDSDQTNPDHLWFFNQKTLRALLEKIGFTDIRMTMRKRIERENFIYCVASKP